MSTGICRHFKEFLSSRQGLLATGIFLAAMAFNLNIARAAPITDPTGDTFNGGAIDITSTNVGVVGPNIVFTLTFAGNIAAPSALAGNIVVGFIDIDIDQNAATGGTAPWGGPVVGGNNWINFFIPPNPGISTVPGPLVSLGDEFYIDLGSEVFHPGLVDIVRTSNVTIVGVAPVSYVTNTLNVNVPLALLGNDSSLNYGAIVGTPVAPTDRAPNGASPLSSVPEPGSLTLLALGLSGLFAAKRRVRQ